VRDQNRPSQERSDDVIADDKQTKLADAQAALDEALKKLEEQRLKSANDEP
jgi:hypothetical protein